MPSNFKVLLSVAAALFIHYGAIAAPPNLVVFISDDHSYRDTSSTGAVDLQTPNFDRIAGRGMLFTRAFAVSPSCAPSRAALLTGLMPIENGSMFNHQPPRKALKKLPAYLRESGYEVVAFGKVAHYNQGQDYGFDLVAHDSFHDDQCVTAAMDWLQRRRDDRPLCLMVGTNWPHVPWPEPVAGRAAQALRIPPNQIDTPRTRQARARYYAAIERLDHDLGEVFDAAYTTLGDNTLFLHFSDHGAQWPFGKWNLYDEGTHVPFLAVWPDVIPQHSQCKQLTTLLDVLPTLCDAAGGESPPSLPGKSLLPLMKGRHARRRDRLFATHSGDGRMNEFPMRSVRTDRWKYIRNLAPQRTFTTHIDRGNAGDGARYWQSWQKRAASDPAAAAIVNRYQRRPAEELYDLLNDPFEQRNRAAEAEFQATLVDLRNSLDASMHESHDQGLTTENAMKPKPDRPK